MRRLLREKLILGDRLGLHARPAAALALGLRRMDAAVTLSVQGKQADGRDIMALMELPAVGGNAVIVTAQGTDEAAAMELARSCLLRVLQDEPAWE